jgi:hypothetical protein
MSDYFWIGPIGALVVAAIVALGYFTRPRLQHHGNRRR